MIRYAMPVVALAGLILFLGILIAEVPRLDLGCVIAATLLLAAWDLLGQLRNRQ
ncbi:MAG: hypothetical protein WA954_05935 [Parerythrobacter sp.]